MGKREIYVERGIPCPGTQGGRTMAGVRAREMKIGESIFCELRADYETVRRTLYDLGGRPQTRRLLEDEKWGWRIWRVA